MIRRFNQRLNFRHRVTLRLMLALPIIAGILLPSNFFSRLAAITAFLVNFLSIEYIYAKMRDTSRRLEAFDAENERKQAEKAKRDEEQD